MNFDSRIPQVGEVVVVFVGGMVRLETNVRYRYLKLGKVYLGLDGPSEEKFVPSELVFYQGAWSISRPHIHAYLGIFIDVKVI